MTADELRQQFADEMKVWLMNHDAEMPYPKWLESRLIEKEKECERLERLAEDGRFVVNRQELELASLRSDLEASKKENGLFQEAQKRLNIEIVELRIELKRTVKFAETLAKMGDDAPRFVETINLQEQVWKHREEVTELRRQLAEADERITGKWRTYTPDRQRAYCVYCGIQVATIGEHPTPSTCIVLTSQARLKRNG